MFRVRVSSNEVLASPWHSAAVHVVEASLKDRYGKTQTVVCGAYGTLIDAARRELAVRKRFKQATNKKNLTAIIRPQWEGNE